MGMNALTIDSARVRAGSWRGSDDLAYLVPLSGASTSPPRPSNASGLISEGRLPLGRHCGGGPLRARHARCRWLHRTRGPSSLEPRPARSAPERPRRAGPRRGRRASMRSSTSTSRPSRRSGNSTATGCMKRSTLRPPPVFVSFVTPTSLVTRSPAGLAPRATSSAWPCTPTGRDSDSGSTSLWTRSTGSAAATSPRVGSTPKRRTPPRSRFTRGWASSRLVTS